MERQPIRLARAPKNKAPNAHTPISFYDYDDQIDAASTAFSWLAHQHHEFSYTPVRATGRGEEAGDDQNRGRAAG